MALLESQVIAPVNTLPSFNPPLFFEIVEDQVYCSNKCDASSFPFLATLHIRTVIYLSPDELSRELAAYFREKDINVIHLGAKYRSALRWKSITEGLAKEAIEHMLDKRRHPVMVMCKTGIHLSGTVIGCLRRLQNWSLTATIDKYRNLANTVNTRFENEQFIELFDVDLVTLPKHLPDWFLFNQQLLEEERQTLMDGSRHIDSNAVAESSTESHDETQGSDVPAYQEYYFSLQGPLVSPGVKFSEKKSIIGDDDD